MRVIFCLIFFTSLDAYCNSLKPVESYRKPDRILISVQGCYANAIKLASIVGQYISVDLLTDRLDCEYVSQHKIFDVNVITSFARDWAPLYLEDLEENKHKKVIAAYKASLDTSTLANMFQNILSDLYISVAGGNFQVNESGVCVTAVPNWDGLNSYKDELNKSFKNIGCKKIVFLQPAFAEKTKHVDILFQFIDDKNVVLAYDKNENLQINSKLFESNINILKENGFNVFVIPQSGAFDTDSKGKFVHISYVNSLILGDKVFVPQYGIADDKPAIEAWSKTGLQPIPVLLDFPFLDGSIHCMTSPVYN